MQIKLVIIGYNRVIINRKTVINNIYRNFYCKSLIGRKALALKPTFTLKGGKSENPAP